ncbi:uncharacterized protein EKO05_0006853 [Ascochyta rabiei]|uniref:uncharacterized protein n=1 Tax=Didymella rabiei TaxID=5454 RepID=UPI0019005054|nr:uncharacterized protein EKO05_0006853 [Ascochyta rabiei]UPX16454.1 hypothetical protein EKO05_0006853 [Ascochyta rabiei]
MSAFQHRLRILGTLVLGLLATTQAQDSKRGFAFIGDSHAPDNKLLSSDNSPLAWYYNWSPYPNTNLIPTGSLEFVPMIHGMDATQDGRTESAIRGLDKSNTHLLSFNEPDGTTGSGGSSISPEDAARAYIDYVVPFRNGSKGGRNWKISHPSTTGSPSGLEWLRSFNSSCYDIDPENGCPTDFVAVTELGLPQESADATVGMMNQTLPYLDSLDYVERYAWFGAFRTDDANEWTGDGVALFDDDGGLTELGALYMGNGFKEGQKGGGADSAAGMRRVNLAPVVAGLVAVLMSTL